jgi:hypothetical protein
MVAPVSTSVIVPASVPPEESEFEFSRSTGELGEPHCHGDNISIDSQTEARLAVIAAVEQGVRTMSTYDCTHTMGSRAQGVLALFLAALLLSLARREASSVHALAFAAGALAQFLGPITLLVGNASSVYILVVLPLINNPVYLDPELGGFVEWAVPAAILIAIVMAAAVAGFIYVRRDLAGLWVALAGLATGVVAAIVSAPIAAYVFEGVTGSGTDLIVAALRQGGADVLQASLGQGFFSDPIDKIITSFVVYLILISLSPRFLARFPNGERLARPASSDGPAA